MAEKALTVADRPEIGWEGLSGRRRERADYMGIHNLVKRRTGTELEDSLRGDDEQA